MRWYQTIVSPWIAYPVLVIFSLVVAGSALYFYIPKKLLAQSYIQPFEGTIEDIDYVSCVCGLALLMTIVPTQATAGSSASSGQQQYLFYYGAQILEQLGVEWEIDGYPIPIPRMYLVAPYVAYSQQALGNYLPGEFPCVAYSGNSCSVEGYYPAIINIGAAAVAKQ